MVVVQEFFGDELEHLLEVRNGVPALDPVAASAEVRDGPFRQIEFCEDALHKDPLAHGLVESVIGGLLPFLEEEKHLGAVEFTVGQVKVADGEAFHEDLQGRSVALHDGLVVLSVRGIRRKDHSEISRSRRYL